MSGYKLVIGFVAIIIVSILWIALNEGVSISLDIFNSMATDPDVIARNNMAASIFYGALFFIIIMIAIWILKSSIPRRPQGVYGYE